MSICNVRYHLDQIKANREYIYQQITMKEIQMMDDLDLVRLFRLYDTVFFDQAIQRFFKEHPKHILSIVFGTFGEAGQHNNFGENGEQIDTNGISGHSQMEIRGDQYIHTIFISRPIFGKLFRTSYPAECTNGLRCHDQLSCLMITMEHEITHLIIDLFCKDLQNGHGNDFKDMVYRLFGHTSTNHSLGSQCQI